MNKKIKLFAAAALMCASVANASWVYYAKLANEVVTTNKKYTLDINQTPNAAGMTRVSAQAVYVLSGSTTAFTSSSTLQWSVSNDGVNYSTMTPVTTYSVASSTPSNTIWDFANVNYRYLQLAVTSSTNSATNLVVTVNGKNN